MSESESSLQRGLASRGHTSGTAKVIFALAVLSAVACAAQLVLWLSAEQGDDTLVALLFLAPAMAVVVALGVLLPSMIVLWRDPGTVSKWALGLALAVVVVLGIEFMGLVLNFLDSFLDGLRH